MARWNTFQKDLLIITLLAVLHLLFTAIFPLRGMDAGGDVLVTREFFLYRFEFLDTGETVTYLPVLTGVYVLFLIALILKKPRSQALIYGLGLVLVTKFSFLSELSALEGRALSDLETTGFISMTLRASGEIVAQDLAGYLLLALFLIKAIIVSHTIYMKRKKSRMKQDTIVQTKNEVPS
ncbi:MAG: hypothetical protein ACOCU5_03235 [Bacillota bacterium]